MLQQIKSAEERWIERIGSPRLTGTLGDDFRSGATGPTSLACRVMSASPRRGMG